MLREIRDLGFEYAELSHNTRISLLPGIIEAVDAGEMRISSLHNFCPLPMGVNYAAPNLYEFSAENARERDLAHRHTLKTLETAARLKAPAVVLHLGSIDMRNCTDRLRELAARNQAGTPKYQRLCAEADERREARKEAFFARAIESLRKLLPEAESRGITFGIENREALEELPLESDFGFLFRELKSRSVGYWHDTGHAQIKENLGFIRHTMLLESQQHRLLGFHVHDAKYPGPDHGAPGTGTVDFAALKPCVRESHIKVFEFAPALAAAQVRAGVEHLRRLWQAP